MGGRLTSDTATDTTLTFEVADSDVYGRPNLQMLVWAIRSAEVRRRRRGRGTTRAGSFNAEVAEARRARMTTRANVSMMASQRAVSCEIRSCDVNSSRVAPVSWFLTWFLCYC